MGNANDCCWDAATLDQANNGLTGGVNTASKTIMLVDEPEVRIPAECPFYPGLDVLVVTPVAAPEVEAHMTAGGIDVDGPRCALAPGKGHDVVRHLRQRLAVPRLARVRRAGHLRDGDLRVQRDRDGTHLLCDEHQQCAYAVCS